uniref:Calponin-homology (CH) domain-containing protein n=1 Tax=Heterorhabditis bacteriophora TaxID=37862 RepID=A0A1I7X5B4_HETBA
MDHEIHNILVLTNKVAPNIMHVLGFGVPRDVIDKVKSENLAEITDEEKIKNLKGSTWLQSGTNKFASQKGQTAICASSLFYSGFGSPRDVNYKTKGTGGASEVKIIIARASDGIVPLQSGTNKLASQAGMTGIGMPRIVDDQDRESQGFVHLQMGTNRFANQSGMTGFGMPRHNITKYKDEVRGEMPHDEGSTSRQTTGWREGASQAGMTGFGAFRNNTVAFLQAQEQRSQVFNTYTFDVSNKLNFNKSIILIFVKYSAIFDHCFPGNDSLSNGS